MEDSDLYQDDKTIQLKELLNELFNELDKNIKNDKNNNSPKSIIIEIQ